MTGRDFQARREAAGFSREEIGEISGHPAAVVLHAEQGRIPAYHWIWKDLESALELAEAWHAEELARAANVAQEPPAHQDLEQMPSPEVPGLGRAAFEVAQPDHPAGMCLHGMVRDWCSICAGTRRIPLSSLDAAPSPTRGGQR